MNLSKLCYVLGITLWLCACSRQADRESHIVGTVRYATPITFASGATVELRLSDVSVDGPATTIAQVRIDAVTQLPYQFSLPYSAEQIDPQHRYMVDARISVAKQLRYITDSAYPVLTQGATAQPDLIVMAAGDTSTASVSNTRETADVFHGEWRDATGVTLYQAGFVENQLIWLEEDRSNGTPMPLHARYDLKGAYLIRYRDSSPLEILFDARGKPTRITQRQQDLVIDEHRDLINAARNRAELLRADALAGRETQAHRRETKSDES